MAATVAVRRFDLLGAARELWHGVEVDPTGSLIEPASGTRSPVVALVEGQHRGKGARYSVTPDATSPKLDATVGEHAVPGRLPPLALDMRSPLDVGCVGGLLGGDVVVRGSLVAERLESGGRLLDLTIGNRRVLLDVRLDVRPSATRWDVDVAAELRGRGIGRVALLFGRSWLRRQLHAGLAAMVAAGEAMTDEVERAGGPAVLLRQLIWPPDVTRPANA